MRPARLGPDTLSENKKSFDPTADCALKVAALEVIRMDSEFLPDSHEVVADARCRLGNAPLAKDSQFLGDGLAGEVAKAAA
jgi:hypothetical protein